MRFIPCREFCPTPIHFGDKSITHRALIIGYLSSGVTEITNACICADTLSTVNCLRALGAVINITGYDITVTRGVLPQTHVILDCGNSATSARLLAGVVAGLGLTATFTGDRSLLARPMEILDALTAMGADTARHADGTFTVSATRRLNGIHYTTRDNSAQTKSALLLAGLYAEGDTTVCERLATRDHTERMLAYFGAKIYRQSTTCTVTPSAVYAQKVHIANDPSVASYLTAIALHRGRVTLPNICVNEYRIGYFRLLQRAGANIEFCAQNTCQFEPCADIVVTESRLEPLKPSLTPIMEYLDEVPISALTASTVQATTKFDQLEFISVKESNRILSTAKLLNSLGIKTVCDSNSLTVYGNSVLAGGTVDASGDHRIAMTAVVAGMLSRDGVCLTDQDVNCIAVSCPRFLDIIGAQYIDC